MPPRSRIVRLRAVAAGMQQPRSQLLPRHRCHHDNTPTRATSVRPSSLAATPTKTDPMSDIFYDLEQRKRPEDPARYRPSSTNLFRQFAAFRRRTPSPRPGDRSSSCNNGHERNAYPTDARRQYLDVMQRYTQRLDSFTKPYKGPWERAANMNSFIATYSSFRDMDLGAFNLAHLQWCQGAQPSRWARMHLNEYWRRVNIHPSGNSKESIEAAKARLAADNAAWRVYKWIYEGRPVRNWFEQNLDRDPSAKGENDSEKSFHRRRTLRCHLLQGTVQAIYRWGSEDACNDVLFFLLRCANSLDKHLDIAPVLVREIQSNRHRVGLELAAFDLYC
ncbi:hypothetical protein PG993_008407 [Apiospora rasikravindrae]|uniref:Uncharacterized protein n=1 Tax=Apiospora rasikravindrae TaxID=990691 RepID=A0ABR1T1P7_9PEZI